MAYLPWQDIVRRLIPPSFKRFIIGLMTSDLVGALLKKYGWITSRRGGGKFFVGHERISGQEAASIFWGFRERAEVDFVTRLLPIDSTTAVVELGGSIGVVAGAVAKRRPKQMVVVEADPKLLDLCEINLGKNAYPETRIEYSNSVVTYQDSAAVEFIRGSTTTSGKIKQHDGSEAGLMIQPMTLSTILARYSIDEYVLISDIEGAEADIWFKDEGALENCHAIVVELEDTERYSTESQVKQLQDLGFTQCYRYGRVYFFDR